MGLVSLYFNEVKSTIFISILMPRTVTLSLITNSLFVMNFDLWIYDYCMNGILSCIHLDDVLS